MPAADAGTLREGRVVRWNDARGFGFIRPDDGGKDVFLHISCMAGLGPPPVGSRWVFSAAADPKGRGLRVLEAAPAAGVGEPSRIGSSSLAASGAQPTSLQRPRSSRHGRRRGHQGGHATSRRVTRRDQPLRAPPLNPTTWLVAAATLFCLVAVSVRFATTGWVLALYPLMSLVAYLMYARDKLSAIRGQWRVPESSLHLIELLGGWPGAYLAQQMMRHKTAKGSYQAVYWLIVLLHVATATLWLAAPGFVSALAEDLVQRL